MPEEKKRDNWLREMVAHLAMGIGGSLTGQDYLGNFMKWKAEKEAAGQGVPVYTFGPNGELINAGNVPQGAKVVPPSSTITPEARNKLQEDLKKQKNIQDIQFSSQRVKNLLTSTVRAIKSVNEKTREATGREPGRIAGMYNVLGGMTGMNPEVKPFEGQKLETAAALARIAMPGIRSQRAITQFYKTLPEIGSNEEEIAGQIRNSYHNAMSTAYASRDLTYDEKAREGGDKIVDEILASSGYGKKVSLGNGPKKGDVVDGYVFKGGDPADKNNWEKQ